MLHISDFNYADFIGDGNEVEHDGHTRYLTYKGKAPSHGLCLRPVSADFPIIPKAQWVERIKAKKGGLKELGDFYGIKVKNQDGRKLCWAYGSTSVLEYTRAKQGQPYLELAPESVSGPTNNWSNQGGWGETALEQLQKGGACAETYLDSQWSLSPKRWKTGWEQNALNNRVVEWYEVNGIEEVITLLLNDFPMTWPPLGLRGEVLGRGQGRTEGG